jgi:sigma-B regulation protein RsbU (phosphoserine phosphatase)
MEALNNALVDAIPLYSFVTFQLGIFHLDAGRLLLVNAGHHSPLCFRPPTRGVEQLQVPSNLPLGATPNCLFQIREHPLKPGDRIIVHTDGITECGNDRREEFGLTNLIRTIEQHGHHSAKRLLHEIKQHASRFSSRADPEDDQAVLVI